MADLPPPGLRLPCIPSILLYVLGYSSSSIGCSTEKRWGMDDLLNTGWLLSWKATPTLPKSMHSGDGILQDLHAFSQNPFPHPSFQAFWPQLQRTPSNSSACVPQTWFDIFAEFLFSDILYMWFDTWSRLLCVFYSELLASGGGQTSCRFSDLYRKHLKSSCNKCWILGHIPDQLNIYSDILLSLADSKKSPGRPITWVFLLITSQTFINGFRTSASMQFPVIMAAIVLLCSVKCGRFIYTGVCLSKLWLISLPVCRRWTPAELKDR